MWLRLRRRGGGEGVVIESVITKRRSRIWTAALVLSLDGG